MARAAQKTSGNKIVFGKKTIAAIEPPERGKRVIYSHQNYPRLKLRVTPTAKTFFFEAKERGQHVVRTIGSAANIEWMNALEQAKHYSAAMTQGRDLVGEAKELREELTLEELWLDYRANRKKKQPGKESESLPLHWNKYLSKWKAKRLSEISDNMARNLILGIRKEKMVQANRVHTTAKAMFNHAIQELRWKGANPFLFAKASEAGREHDRRLEPHEVRPFLDGLKATTPMMRDLFKVLLFTGRRPGEVQAMRWEDIDLAANLWHIPTTKAGKREIVGLAEVVVDTLNARWATAARDAEGEAPTGWVFPTNSKSGHVEELKNAWAKVIKAAKIKHICPKDLRTTFSSWAQDQKIPTAIVSKVLGHGSESTTAKHYTSVLEETRRSAMEITAAAILAAAEE